MSSFGERFKKIRTEKNYTQDKLAEDFNKRYGHSFSKSTISQYEHDKRNPDYDVLVQFAEFFNISIDYLLCNDSMLIKELGRDYSLKGDKEKIELEDIVSLILNMVEENKILIDKKTLSQEQKLVLRNSLGMGVHLTKNQS